MYSDSLLKVASDSNSFNFDGKFLNRASQAEEPGTIQVEGGRAVINADANIEVLPKLAEAKLVNMGTIDGSGTINAESGRLINHVKQTDESNESVLVP